MRSFLSGDDWWITLFLKTSVVQRAVIVGITIGLLGGLIGLGLSLIGPVFMLGGVIGLLGGLYILTNLEAGLYASLIILGVLPFGTLPFKIGFTPTLLDVTLGAFLLVYIFQWMTGRRRLFQMTPVHGLVIVFALVVLFAFVLGLGHASLTPNVLRQFAELILAMVVALVLGDVIRDEATLRRVLLFVLGVSAVTAVIGIVLWLLPDATTESLLVRLARFGYPDGGVVRYVEENPDLAERAIGVWIDPNALGGALAVMGGLLVPQVFTRKPLGGRRWLSLGALGAVGVAILLTFSRGALLSLGLAVVFVAVLRYRKLLWLMLAAGILLLVLPFTQAYVARLIEGFQVADLATQMRVGEITDALKLIGRYPVFGVGFSGTPTRDVYLGVANLYLSMAGNTGLVGLGTFGLLIAGFFGYGLRAWRRPGRPARFEALWLGTHAGIVAALGTGLFDYYFFKLEFQPSVTLFWLVLGLGLTTSRLWLQAEAEAS